MQLKNKINVRRYLIITLTGYGVALYNLEQHLVLTFFYLGIMLNHYFLLKVGAYLTGVEENKGYLPVSFYKIMKFLILITVFLVAMQNTVNYEFFLVAIYIFQLIIFAISTKTDVKYMKGTK